MTFEPNTTLLLHQAAEDEGWWFSTRDDGYYQIQKFDSDPKQRFGSDTEALRYVETRAVAGSRLHQLALQLNGTKAVTESQGGRDR